MHLLTSDAQVYLDGGNARQTYTLYKTASAQGHATADDTTLRTALIRALNMQTGGDKVHQGAGVYRVRINNRRGYLVYKTPCIHGQAASAAIFHYHWNYHLDLPLDET
ncbi:MULTISPECIES: hypothetical protein [unclassified Massilia]|uniref:hypothetical protein n=1 Tax=unclassified Massilia TaxID=2609279 RepID=UPI00177CE7F5|nr:MULTISPECIES: hypothetical protein [unclassified Massilia]MBD8528888.1 hypothetical protein [Massilia sp. CFBP 13647]MBD8673530.1 hypothetical protein [Massilia sp. CFBP 13721]